MNLSKFIRRLFAPKFIKTNCFLIDRKLQELDIPQEGEPASLLIRLKSIDSIRETWDDDNKKNSRECMIFYRSGDTIVIGQSYKVMEKLLTKYGYL